MTRSRSSIRRGQRSTCSPMMGLVAAFNPIDDADLLKSESFPKVFLEREGLPEPARLYRALTKVALVIRTLRFSPGLLRWLLAVAPEASVEILDLTQLPAAGAADSLVYAAYTGWGWLRRAIDLRDRVLGAPDDLVDLLGLIFAETFVKATTLARRSRLRPAGTPPCSRPSRRPWICPRRTSRRWTAPWRSRVRSRCRNVSASIRPRSTRGRRR
jgi:hypothetical protein